MENIFGKYRIAAPITTKSSNPAYRARLTTITEWSSVVKVYNTRILHSEQAKNELLSKIEALIHLEHPYILSVIEYGFERGIPYSVTKYMECGSLRDRLNQVFPEQLNSQDAMKIILQVGQALQYAHEHHVLHGNIKPENILFNENNEALLADFHLPENHSETNDDGNKALSTYYPPLENLSEKSDQYALGCLAYELFADQLHTATHLPILAAVSSSVEPPLEETETVNTPNITSEWTERIEAILLKAMAEEPNERYENVAALFEAIDEVYTTQFMVEPVPVLSSAESWPAAKLFHTKNVVWQHPAALLMKMYQMSKGSRKQRLLIAAIPIFILGALCTLLFSLFSPAEFSRQGDAASRSGALRGTVIAVTPQGTQAMLQQRIATSTPILYTNTVSSVPPTPSVQANSSPASASGSATPTPHTSAQPGSSSGDSSSGSSSSSGDSPQPSPTVMPTPTPIPTPVPTPTPIPVLTRSCHIGYTESRWNFSGSVANITITNTGQTVVNQWNLQWTFPGNQRIINAWNAHVVQSGQYVTLTNEPWNGTIAPGGSTAVGFTSTFFGRQVASPSTFTLNGITCH